MKLPKGGKDPAKANVYRKSYEIAELLRSMIEIADENNHDFGLLYEMMNKASRLSVLISHAEFVGIYDIQVDIAYVVKYEYKNLKMNLEFMDPAIIERKYIELVATEIEEFRPIFLDWVKSFDRTYRASDEWDFSEALSEK